MSGGRHPRSKKRGKPRATLRDDERGLASSMIAFLVAGVLFLGSVGAVILTTRQGATGAAASTVPQADLAVQAESLSKVLVMSPGYTVDGGDWVHVDGVDPVTGATTPGEYADKVRRLGLKDANHPHDLMMSFDKFQNLRMSPYDSAMDGYVNYPDARKGFGLDKAGLDFHIRAYPTLPEIREILDGGRRDGSLKVAYIGDVVDQNDQSQGVAGLGVALPLTCRSQAIDPSDPHPRAFRISTQITNGGSTDTQFEAIFELRFANGDVEYHKKNTLLVPRDPDGPGGDSGGIATIRADSAATDANGNNPPAARSCTGLQVNLRIYDTSTLLWEKTVTPTVIAGTAPSTAPRAILVESASENFRPTDKVKFLYNGQNITENNNLILTVCPLETECRLGSDTNGWRANLGATDGKCQNENPAAGCIKVPKQESKWSYEFPANTFPAGTYTVRLYDNTAVPDPAIEENSMRARNRVLVTSDPIAPYTVWNQGPPPPFQADDASKTEADYLERLIENFCPSWFNSKILSPLPLLPIPWDDKDGDDQGNGWDPDEGDWVARCSFKNAQVQNVPLGLPHVGDVYPAEKKVLKDHLSSRLMVGGCAGTPTYAYTNILIVGSDVDHNVMTSNDVKGCIEAWVLGGGTLIVFGSADMNTHWLESVFHAAETSSSGGLSVPDAGHPVLHVADDLDYLNYKHNRAWSLKTTGDFDAEAAFTRVANDDATGDAVLAVGDPGAFGSGNVILTGWLPYNLKGTSPGSAEEEGLKFINNLIMLGYRDLYLDYGPPLPPNANVQPAVSRVQIIHPEFEDGPILLNLAVYVFKSG